jgi:hypothetical protein
MRSFQHSTRSGRKARDLALLVIGLAFWTVTACSSDSNNDGAPVTNTGQACKSADQCYPGVKDGDLVGDPVCLDRVTDGYCTHLCTQDSDCCAAAGECAGNHAEVCSPFESAAEMYCFLSCEDADLKSASLTDADQYCHSYAGAAFNCRSTGGGSKNRKVCTP